MKKLLMIMLLLSSQLSTIAQMKITITLPDSIIGKGSMQNMIKQALKDAGAVPPVTISKCKEGPVLRAITNVSATYLNAQFHGDGVIIFSWSIKNSAGEILRSGDVTPTNNTPGITYSTLSPGDYTLTITGKSCSSEASAKPFTVPGKDVGVIVPPNTTNSGSLGTYKTRIGGRNYTFNKTPELSLAFNQDGTISDNTAALNKSGSIHKLGDQNVFYAIGNYPLETSSGSGQNLQNIYLPDGIYTITQYVCKADKVPDFARFKSGFEGWNGIGVNADNARRSQIFLSINSDSKQGNGTVPAYLKVSRTLVYPEIATLKDWRKYKKFNAIGASNGAGSRLVYHRSGINTYFRSEDEGLSSMWRTDRIPERWIPSNDDLYGAGRANARFMGNDINAAITDEYEENTQGTGGDINFRMSHYYRGFYDQINEVTGETDAAKMGAFGTYGGDQWYGAFGAGMDRSYKLYVESLTDHLYDAYNGNTDTWFKEANYYKSGAVNFRNLNYKLYYYNKTFQTPYELIYINERIKLGTKTYEGKDRERNVILFTSPKSESFVADFAGGVEKRNWIEMNDTGELIPFAGGEMLSQVNGQVPAPWDQMYTDALWSNLICGGVFNWDAGSTFGSDTTKFMFWGADWQARWKATGSANFENYVPDQHGAPANDGSGMMHRLYSSPLDAHLAAQEVIWSVRDKIQKISHVAYQSAIGNFTPIPGDTGLHLNGFGEVNRNQFNIYNIYKKQLGIALLSEGSGGSLIWYYNGFLSPQLYEDVTIKGKTFRAYGRQTVIIEL